MTQGYALNNRRVMLETLASVVQELTGHEADWARIVNIHHNYATREKTTYFDHETGREETKMLWITRKGATSAKDGQYGIIPGSMGVGSFIVCGKGSKDSWESCSHGAGRRMSRTKAKKIILQNRFYAHVCASVCARARVCVLVAAVVAAVCAVAIPGVWLSLCLCSHLCFVCMSLCLSVALFVAVPVAVVSDAAAHGSPPPPGQ